MKLRVIGCHGGATSGHRNVSFVIDGRTAIDAGSLASGLTLEEQAALETIVVTHSHLDHVGDLASILDTRTQMNTRPVVVAAIQETIDALRAHYFNNVLWPDFEKIPMQAGPALNYRLLKPELPSQVDGLHITPILVDHSVPSAGLLIEDEAHLVAYSGDTGPTDRFWDALNERDNLRALITEVSFPNHMEELALLSGHLTPNMLRIELDKLERQPEQGIFIYGMKPLFVDAILEEMRPLESRGVRLLGTLDQLEF